MRPLLPASVAALNSGRPVLCMLIRMDLTEPVFASSAGLNVEWDGELWLGVATVGKIEKVIESVGERSPLRFTLTSVPNEMLALAMESATEARGKRCRVWLAIHDPDTYQILEAEQIWSGTVDQMLINEGKETGSVSVTAEHRGVTFSRPKPVRYTDADQRRLYPGDKALQYIVSQSTHQDVWPAAAWFKK
jgi:hypothetical protein